jgi:peroxiredoxin
MKQLFVLLAMTAFLTSCNQLKENQFEVIGTIEGLDDNTKIILERQNELGQFIALDSTTLKDGKFTFKNEFSEPEFQYIQFKEVPGKLPFIAEKGTISIIAYKDSLHRSSVKGTYSNDQYLAYIKEGEASNKKRRKFQEENNSKWMDAQQTQDTAVINALIKENKKYEDEMIAIGKKHIKNHPKSFISVLFLDHLAGMPDEDKTELKKWYDNLSETLKNTKPGKSALEKLNFVAPKLPSNVGQEAPNFSAPNPDGKVISLKENLGKVTIIDFWASWCKPCRIENPNMVALYNDFKGKGLQIIGVSLDQENAAAAWKQAIAVDKLTWIHMSNLKHWKDPIAQLYGVESIPAIFILDENGTIVAKDLRGDALRAKIAELLGV